MGAIASWFRLRKATASVLAVAVIIGVPLTFAVLHQGFPVTDVDLSARDVWVTNGKQLLAGRLNRQIEELNGSVNAASSTFDVFQDGDDVFLFDGSAGSLERVDASFTTLGQRVDVPVGSEVAFGGDTLAVMAPGSGSVWVINAGSDLNFDPKKSDPVMKLGKGGHIAVSKAGAVFGTSPLTKKLVTLARTGDKPSRTDLPKLGAHQVAAVGEKAVVLDTVKNRLIVDGGEPVGLPANGLKLQQSGAENSFAVVATGEGLLEVPLGGGKAVAVSAGMERMVTDPKAVSKPVWLDGCAHGAWAGAQRYLAACAGKKPSAQAIAQPTLGSTLEFRVNRNVIALNNLSNGNVWLVDANMRLVENWDEVTPPEEEDSEEGDEKASQQSFEDTLAERTPQNRAPLAHDDEYGVRPGKTTVLPVLENDTDPDGDVLTVVNTNGFSEAQGRLDYIDGGRALQFTPAPAMAGTATFRYTVADGRGAVAEASVNLTVRPADQNLAPVSHRAGAISVEQGQLVSYNVLSDWIDPDGDDIYLVSASPTTGDGVRFGPEGFVTFESKTAELGVKEVPFVVSDGVVQASGVLTVDVKAPGSLNPVGTPDFASTFVGETVLVEPLKNDVSPSGAALGLIGVTDVPGSVSAVANLDRGTVAFSAPEAGSYVFTYSLGAGATSSVGLIRVDVKESPAGQSPPIAVKDTAYLRAGEPLTVPVLNNDVSPTGRVLAVQSVDTSATDDLVTVEILTNTVLRVTTSAALTQQVQFTYTISDGQGTSTAGITVVPVPPLVKHQPPVAVDDSVNVRAGDIVSVPVLANDYHPDSATMSVLPVLADVTNAGGLAFVTGNQVRFQAPKEPGAFSVAYTITDPYLETATAVVHFTVVGPDTANNQAPTPVPLTMRTFADSTIEVKVPLDGIDPDGDSVFLKEVTSPPGLGRIIRQGSDSFVYQAFPGTAGTDTFTYEVEDTLGSTAKGTVRIGVIPRPVALLPPNAVDDAIEIKPGRTGSIPVVLNDSDPNGYKLTLAKKLPEVADGIRAKVNGSRIIVDAPEVEGTYTLRYAISNGHGGAATAFVQVKVTQDAKAQYPTATDHYLEPKQVLAKDTVTLTVRDKAENPGGLVEDLTVSLEGPNAASGEIGPGGKVTVTPTNVRQAIAYRLTNEIDHLSATAFIIVPAKPDGNEKKKPVEEQAFPPPFLKPLPEQLVRMNGSKNWTVADIVEVPSGRPALVLSASATNSNGAAVQLDPTTLGFVPQKDFRGPASVTFVVTDGSSAADPKGNQATLTIPITVGDPNSEDVPPTFTPPNVTIEAGEKALAVNLRASSGHPNPQVIEQLRYGTLTGSSTDVAANLDGANLVVSAPLGVQPGSKVTLSFTVTYKEFTIPGSVNVTVVSSTRAKPQAVDDAGPNGEGIETRPGTTLTIPVLDNDYNPYSAEAKPLTVIKADIEQQVGTATVSHTASGVTVKTGSGATGTLTVVYRIQDATRDPLRETQGRVTLVVRNVPDAPRQPSASAGDGRVTIRFSAPAANNSPITGYVVRYDGKTERGCTPGVDCVLPATNGQSFTATVAAVNAIGEGSPSPASPAVTPYGAPTAPRNPDITSNGNAPARLTMSWNAPAQTGGGSVRYQWQLNSGGWNDTTATSASVGGKGAGQYSFEVRAINTGGGAVGPVAASSPVQVSDPPPPTPTGTVLKGDPAPYCIGCRYVGADFANLPSGNYSVITEINGSSATFSTTTVNLGGNGRLWLQNGLGKRNSDSIRVRFTNNGTGAVYHTRATTNWDGLGVTPGGP